MAAMEFAVFVTLPGLVHLAGGHGRGDPVGGRAATRLGAAP